MLLQNHLRRKGRGEYDNERENADQASETESKSEFGWDAHGWSLFFKGVTRGLETQKTKYVHRVLYLSSKRGPNAMRIVEECDEREASGSHSKKSNKNS